MNFRRRVYYISGYDPRGPSHYHALYKQQCAEQCKINGMRINVSERQRVNAMVSRWQIHAEDQGQVVETDYHFLRWDDIIRRHWAVNPVDLLKELLFNFRVYLLTDVFSRSLKISWPVTCAGGLLPHLYILLMLLLTLGIAELAQSAATHHLLPMAVSYVLGIMALALLGWVGKKVEKALQIYWLLRISVFLARYARGNTPEMETRINDMAKYFLQADHSDVDEVLVVGHSVGTLLAISMLARVRQENAHTGQSAAAISLLTLGHCVPLLGLQASARVFREELAQVAEVKQIKWLDFTAPSDSACYVLSDPVTACGVVRTEAMNKRPKLLSPRYVKLFSQKNYAALRRDKFRMHFQYLMASEITGDYDYFAITAGKMTLPHRFTGHKSINNYKAQDSSK